MTEGWRDIEEFDWDWSDSGPVEMMRGDGSIVRGSLGFDCYGYDDEVPVPMLLNTDDGVNYVDVSNFVAWKPSKT
jgi:hypothetical protein